MTNADGSCVYVRVTVAHGGYRPGQLIEVDAVRAGELLSARVATLEPENFLENPVKGANVNGKAKRSPRRAGPRSRARNGDARSDPAHLFDNEADSKPV